MYSVNIKFAAYNLLVLYRHRVCRLHLHTLRHHTASQLRRIFVAVKTPKITLQLSYIQYSIEMHSTFVWKT
jgi:hypothetical protein